MCGLAGIISPQRRSAIEAMTNALAHRGPDDEGYYRDDHISLGHRRLSIVDLSGGHQPMSNEDGTLQLVCNGEIYNSPELRRDLQGKGHVFKTACDVEVILHLYEDHGKDCVKHLQGMFAFAIWDPSQKTLFLARDHMGQKQLYYHFNGTEFIFASEIKAIVNSNLIEHQIDSQALWHYISLRFMPEDFTLFKGISKLPPATSLQWHNGKLTTEKYWSLSFKNKVQKDPSQIEDDLDDLLRKTIESHLLSDVRVGAFLSGGIDSGTISAVMATLIEDRVPTFSIGVKEHSFNELKYSRMVNERYGMEQHEKVVEADIIGLLPSMVHFMEEPADPYGVGVFLVSQLANKTVKVVLGGDGGDENFAGYDRFSGQVMLDYYSLIPSWLRNSVIRKCVDIIPNSFAYKSFAQKAAWLNELSFYEGGQRYAESMSFLRFSETAKNQLFADSARKTIADKNSLDKLLNFYNANDIANNVDRMLYTELMTRIPDHALVISDRMTMAHSLECRSPLLDYKLVEYAASIPPSLKLKGLRLKYILRQVAGRYLPDEIVNRPKQGFGFPFGQWMRGELQTFMRNLFDNSRLVELGLFNKSYMTNLVDEHVLGKFDHSYRLWMLINLEIWYWIHIEGQSVEAANASIARLR